ncbi:MAG: polyprenyl synthetase family protein [Clostridia bacterium]|nr:polyprenyl synthetase family protein [Clostridia bacterium]
MMITDIMKTYNEKVNAFLYGILDMTDKDYPVIFEAVNYSVKNGGKRIRPFLVLKFSELAGAAPFSKEALYFASALECIHTYSLIHDDLPCMDDDDLRRGKPTNHKVFGEANATLAGDALNTYAFEVIADSSAAPELKVKAVKALSSCAGMYGMVGGQVMDLIGEERKLDKREYEKMNELKTGALIRCAAKLGLIAAGCEDKETYESADIYASCIGRAFQIRDDILDVTADEAVFGKPVGSDAENGKTTVLSFMSLEKAQKLAEELTEKAKDAIRKYDEKSKDLLDLADFLLNRNI